MNMNKSYIFVMFGLISMSTEVTADANDNEIFNKLVLVTSMVVITLVELLLI
mgnify:CR=1 FL=1